MLLTTATWGLLEGRVHEVQLSTWHDVVFKHLARRWLLVSESSLGQLLSSRHHHAVEQATLRRVRITIGLGIVVELRLRVLAHHLISILLLFVLFVLQLKIFVDLVEGIFQLPKETALLELVPLERDRRVVQLELVQVAPVLLLVNI